MKHIRKIIFILPVFLTLFLTGCTNPNSESSEVKNLKNAQSKSEANISIKKNNINLGEIPIMGGKKDIEFTFTNEGNESVALFEGETSCMCTEAVVKSKDGIISPRIKMRGHGAQANINQVLEPGETATVIATYDPLAHGPNAVGPIKRDVFIKTNSKATPVLQFSFQGTVIKGEKKTSPEAPVRTLPTEKTTFDFQEKSYDFGTIKQSGGKVSHTFSFTYNGEQPIQITGVPTSCACTSATIKPTNLKTGDTGVLTVEFNPNLHEEPDGRFFKTVSLLTDPPLDEIPEIKIWTEIDLDLGEEAFELQFHHDEDEEESHGGPQYQSITPEVFETMLQKKDFVLIDTHIPEQEHIAGTDAFIPYKTILNSPDLPTDKNTKIVLYCRSGSMSRAAAYQLAEEGYTQVFDLVGGKNAFDALLKK